MTMISTTPDVGGGALLARLIARFWVGGWLFHALEARADAEDEVWEPFLESDGW